MVLCVTESIKMLVYTRPTGDRDGRPDEAEGPLRAVRSRSVRTVTSLSGEQISSSIRYH